VKTKYISKDIADGKANILITGGTGLVGRHLSEKLLAKGYNVAIIGRKTQKNVANKYFWDIENKEIEQGAIENADFIIHLAGAGIADKKWTATRKKEIIDSRTKSAELIYNTVLKNNLKIKAFVSSSAVGFYGAITSDKIFEENDLAANDFLGNTCEMWEKSSQSFSNLGIRVAILRTGIVLTKTGGAFEKMIKPVKMGVGSAIGTGKQIVPWIHIDDLCNMYINAIENADIHGVYNAVAPEFVTYQEFVKLAAQVLNKPFFFPKVPRITLKLLFGEMSALLLEGSRISSEKIQKAGFNYQYPKLQKALEDLLKKL